MISVIKERLIVLEFFEHFIVNFSILTKLLYINYTEIAYSNYKLIIK